MPAPAQLTPAHWRRLRGLWRSAGWPCKDNLELDLLAAGLLDSVFDEQGRETLRVTPTGITALVSYRQRHQQALSAHEALVERVALQQQRMGRLVWRGLGLRAALEPEAAAHSAAADAAQAEPEAQAQVPWDEALGPEARGPRRRWVTAMPDVFSIRNTTVEAYAEPVVHEIKVSRADLLSELRRPTKAQAYLALSSQCWYVLREGIAEPEEIPEPFGVMVAQGQNLQTLRPAPARSMRLPFSVWMALARANVQGPLGDDAQAVF